MNPSSRAIIVTCSFLVMGCAHIDFGKDQSGNKRGMTFFEPVPYLFVSTTRECVTTATVTIIPGERRELKFKGGYGSYELSVALSNGMISAVGQKADTKIPETIAAIGTVVGAIKPTFIEGKPVLCKPTATLYAINAKGEPQPDKPIKFPDPQDMKADQ